MSEREKHTHKFLLLLDSYSFLSASRFGVLFFLGSWKDYSPSKKALENVKMSELRAIEQFWQMLASGKQRQDLDGAAYDQLHSIPAGRQSGLEASFYRWCGTVPEYDSSVSEIISW